MSESESLVKASEILRASSRVLFLTGAGVSAESGLPTYRGVSGLYETRITDEGLPIEEMLSGVMLRERPELTWKYLMQIALSCQGKRPNRAHEVMASLESDWDVCVITQNIDGFHGQAGSSNVIEMHGNMQKLICMGCGQCENLSGDLNIHIPPRCNACGAVQRPNVVLFGEMLPELALARYYNELSKGFDAIFVVGTSSVFPYISEPVEQAISQGIPTVEINPEDTHLSPHVSLKVTAKAGDWLGNLEKMLA